MLSIETIVLSKLVLDAITAEIEIAVAEAEAKARTYCNIHEPEILPAGLNFTLANMAVEIINVNRYFAGDESAKAELKSVTMGDTSYSFDTTSKSQALDKLILNYENDLLKYRRLNK